MLRQELGDEVFWNGIRQYYAKFSGKNVLSSDFQAVMEQVSGKDLATFFKQWLDQAGYPKLAVQWQFEADKKTVKIKVEQVQGATQFEFPLDLAVQASDEKIQLQTLRITQKNQEFSFPVVGNPKLISLDPMVRLLMEGKVEPNL